MSVCCVVLVLMNYILVAKSKAKAKKAGPPVPSTFMRKGPHAHGHPMSRPRIYKPKGRPGRNMTLDNTNRTYAQSVPLIFIVLRIVLGVFADTSALVVECICGDLGLLT